MSWNKKRLYMGMTYLFLVCGSVLLLIPLVIAINTAFKPPMEIWYVTKLPSRLYLDNFKIAIDYTGRGLINSLLITGPSALFSVFVGSLAAYPLSMLNSKGNTAIYFMLMAGMYIPYAAVLIPLFLLIKKIGLYDTIPGLWLVHVAYGIPYTTLILRSFFTTVPKELSEAALIDGCGVFGYYWRVMMPVARTGIATTFILQFRGIWNEFLFGLTLTRSPHSIPVTVNLQNLTSLSNALWGPLMAAVLFCILPMVVVFLVFKRQFVAGLTGVYK